MTNAQAQGYAVVALRNLIKDEVIKADAKEVCRALDREMYDLMDIMFEEEAEEKAAMILRGVIK